MNEKIKRFAELLKDRLNEYKAAEGLTYFNHFETVIDDGRKFVKVMRREVRDGGGYDHKMIVAFVNKETGDIFKAASYKAPAKHSRGNVNSPQNGMEAIDAHGFVHYLR